MLKRKSFFILVLCLLFLPPAFSSSEISQGKLEGTFKSFFKGDYWHLDVLDKDGKVWSFICYQGCDEFEAPADTTKYIGKKIRVHWEMVKMDFPDGQKGVPTKRTLATELEEGLPQKK